MRAWIETPATMIVPSLSLSHAVCVRGLKHLTRFLLSPRLSSHAVCVRGLKPIVGPGLAVAAASHAVCVRGLK